MKRWSAVVMGAIAAGLLPAGRVDAQSHMPTSVPTSAPTSRPSSAPSPASQEVVGEAPSAALLKQLADKMSGVETIQATFRQEKKLKALNHTMKLQGYFAVIRPERIAFHVTAPVRYSVLMQNDQMRQWDEDSNRVQTIRYASNPAIKAAMEQFQAWFMGNYGVVANSYVVTVTATDPLAMRFTPREQSAASQMLNQIDVAFTRDLQYLDWLVLKDANGDTTTMVFDRVQFNKPLPEGAWEIPPRAR